MDLALNNGFCEFNQMEKETINGGSVGAAYNAGAIGVILGVCDL